MKKMRIIMIPVMVLSVTLLFFSCGKKGAHKHEHGAESAIEKYWTCPMHPQVHSEEPGKCPLCGMDLVQVEKMKEEKPEEAEEEIDYWTCSMHTQVKKDGPGKCPICGMDLIPLYKREQGVLRLDERTRTLLGIISQKAEYMVLRKIIKLPGRTMADNELYLAQQEYLSSLSRPDLLESARLRLLLFGLDDEDMKVLAEQSAQDKSLIYPGEEIWAVIDVYEADLKNVKKGMQVSMTTPAYPGEYFRGKIAVIEPSVDKMTRTAKARIKVKNPQSKLKFEMYMDVEIPVVLERALAVPAAAVIDTGKRRLVYVEETPGKYRMREVESGIEAENYTQIYSGLKEDEVVVVKGNFFLDSQTTLSGGQALLYDAATEIKGEETKPAHKH